MAGTAGSPTGYDPVRKHKNRIAYYPSVSVDTPDYSLWGNT